jgi:hypothetical protein
MKTTITGALMILSAVISGAISILKGGTPDLIGLGGLVSGGIGLIKAADAKK